MSEKNNEEPNQNPPNLNETNDDGEILTLSDLLNEQREIDEVRKIAKFLLMLPLRFGCDKLIDAFEFIRMLRPFWEAQMKIIAHILKYN